MNTTTSKSVFWSFLEQGGSKAIALVVQIVLARLLAPEAFGLLAIMLVLVDIANVISQSGLGMAIIQDKEADALSCTTAFWLSMALAAVLYLMIFAAAPAVAAFYGMAELDGCLRVIALAIPLNAANSIQRSILQKSMDFKSIFKSNTAAFALSGAAGIAAALCGAGVWALVLQTVLQPAVACLVMTIQVEWHPTIEFDRFRAKSLFDYGWKICLTGIFGVVYKGVSELVIGKACSAEQLGYYSQGRKWPNAGIAVAGNALQNVMFPAFAALQDEPERLRAAIRKALDVGNFVVVPVSLAAAAMAEPVIVLLLGEKWLPCVPVFQMTCVSNVLLMVELVNLRAYMALGDSALYLKLQIVKVVGSCAVIWAVAVATADIYWTAFTTAACGLICVVIVDLRPARRMHGVGRGEQMRAFAPSFMAALPAAAAAVLPLLLRWPYYLTLPMQLAVFAALYLLLARTLRVPGRRECLDAVRGLLTRGGRS